MDDRDDANRWDAEACAEAIVEALTGEVVSDNSDEDCSNNDSSVIMKLQVVELMI